MIRVADDLGRIIECPAVPSRIVSLVPSLTELLFRLGAGTRVAGVTRYCVEPAGEVEAIQRVGGTKDPDLATLIRLQPDLVVVNTEENRRPDVRAIQGAGIEIFITDVKRVRDVPGLMRRLGVLVHREQRSEELAGELERTLQSLQPRAVRRRFFCPIWKNPWMTFSADTYADDLLSLVGGENVCRGEQGRYPRIEIETVAERQPEVILLPDEPYAFGPGDLPALEPLIESLAIPADRVRFIDGKALFWYGPRSASALIYLQACLEGQPISEGFLPVS